MNFRTVYTFAVAVAALVAMPIPAGAQWSLLDNFESSTLGLVNGQGGWTASGTPDPHMVVVDPDDSSNQVLTAGQTNSTVAMANAFIGIGAGIAEGSTGTVFFRMRNDDPGDFVFGSTDMANPVTWSDYEGYMRFASGSIDIRDGGGFAIGTAYDANQWYNVWLVLNNAADTTTMYVSQGADAAVEIVSGAFRNGTTDALLNLNLRMGAPQNTADGYLDDIYVDLSGVNTTLPVGISLQTPGDVTGEGTVDLADYLIIRDNFRTSVGSRMLGDLNGDGTVNFVDFGEWKANASPEVLAALEAIPEPSSLLLALGLGSMLVSRRNVKRSSL